MDADFHYYGTATAAFESGFKIDDAKEIAFGAQFLDWFNSDYWSNWRIVDSKGNHVINKKTNEPFEYANPQLSIQTIGLKAGLEYNDVLWSAFHFPPGNLKYDVSECVKKNEEVMPWQKKFHRKHVIRTTCPNVAEPDRLCRPYSKFAIDLIKRTVQQYRSLASAEGDALDRMIAKFIGPSRKRFPIKSGKRLALYLLGFRMHVFADTWAHQDFAGNRDYWSNAAHDRSEAECEVSKGRFQKIKWTGPGWQLNTDTDCACMFDGNMPFGSSVCAGHSQLGYFPDYSWAVYRYQPTWLSGKVKLKGETKKGILTRNNPKEYSEAWSWINFVLGLCNGRKDPSDSPDGTPKEIEAVIGHRRRLSTKVNRAILDSEKLWESNVGISGFLPKRLKLKKSKSTVNYWKEINNTKAKRKKLGVWDGEAWTRYGYINVMQESTLHYIELAAAMHYQFCFEWAKTNKEYSWKPEPAKT